jgi:DNA-binding CsgD family transcriptional regulator
VIQLAKKGDQRFLARFKEVYHDFYDTLTSRYPTLTTGDIKICALLKLNFTTKEISEIEIISIRTVENKKYRIRKKLELPSEVDLSKWMMEL